MAEEEYTLYIGTEIIKARVMDKETYYRNIGQTLRPEIAEHKNLDGDTVPSQPAEENAEGFEVTYPNGNIKFMPTDHLNKYYRLLSDEEKELMK